MAAINIFPIYDDSNDNIVDYRPVLPVVVENIPSILIDGHDVKSEYGAVFADGNYTRLMQFPNSKGVQYNEWDEQSGLDVDFNRALMAASKGIDLTFHFKKSTQSNFAGFHNFMMSSATHTLSYFGRLSTDAFPPITLRLESTKINYVNEFIEELATQHSVTYHFVIDKPYIPDNVMSWTGSAYDFSIVPYYEDEDVVNERGEPLIYNGNSFYIGHSVGSLKRSMRFCVCLLQGTSLSVQGKPNLKNSFTYSSEFSIGQNVEALTTTAGYSITLNCLMRAPSMAIFWVNYRALLWELFRGLVWKNASNPDFSKYVLYPFYQFIRLDIGYKQNIQLKCYYESCSSKKFIIRKNGNLTPVFWQFSLTFKVYEPATLV